MSTNILVTGAAGYIGGSLLNEISKPETRILELEQIFVAVRTPEQAAQISAPNVNVLQLDLRNANDVTEAILKNKIDLVVHCASAIDPSLAKPLIAGLNQRKQETSKPVHFIHTSGTGSFADKNGWSHGAVKDTDPVFSLIKEMNSSYPTHLTDVEVLEYATEYGVAVYNVVPPLIYGRGSGVSNQLSFAIPTCIHAFIAAKGVFKLPKNCQWPATHIDDLCQYYVGLIVAVLRGTELSIGYDGYFFPCAHQFFWWDVLEKLAESLYAAGYIPSKEVKEWPSVEMAAKYLKFNQEWVEKLYGSSVIAISNKSDLVGWKPQWDLNRFLQSMDDEVKATFELGPSSKLMALPSDTAA